MTKKQDAEAQIIEEIKQVDYVTLEYPTEVIVDKYNKDREDGKNELFIPDYQREMAWDDKRQSKFIESLLIGLPVPPLFVADIGDEDGRLEIVDGSQRIRTLARFLGGELTLSDLPKLTALKGFTFNDLTTSRQRRFKRRSVRMIELTEKANEATRRDIFERINTGSVELQDMEKRRGINQGPFLDTIETLAKNSLFTKLVPLTATQRLRGDDAELVLRFFAYATNYLEFGTLVGKFMNDFLEKANKAPQKDADCWRDEFQAMLVFVEKYFPNGFAKTAASTTTPRVRYDAIAVGAALALREKPELVPLAVDTWLGSKEFNELTTSGSSNSRPRVKKRIEYVRDQLLQGAN